MNNATKAVGLLMIVAAAVFGALAQEQPARSQVRGGMTRSSMYLRLFREIADFEARADAEEAKGVTPSKLRNYHQWRMGLSPVRGAQLRDAALECLKGLKSEGLVDERGGSPGGARVAGRTERIMERVGAAVDSLAAAMGPAEFAYLDSLVRRYMATPTLGSNAPVGLGTGSARGATVQEDSARVGKAEPLSGTCSIGSAGANCDPPTSETSVNPRNEGKSGTANTGVAMLGGWFYPTLLPLRSSSALPVNWGVWESFGGEYDGCNEIAKALQYADAPVATLGDAADWQADENGVYGPDVIADTFRWVQYYVVLARTDSSFAGCGERASQIMSAYGSGLLCSAYAPDYQVNAVGASIVDGTTVMFCPG